MHFLISIFFFSPYPARRYFNILILLSVSNIRVCTKVLTVLFFIFTFEK